MVKDYQTLGDGPGGADKKYRDKLVEVTGIVLSAGTIVGGATQVELSGGEGAPYGVRCWFDDADKAPSPGSRRGKP
jgi:hypothetical protein